MGLHHKLLSLLAAVVLGSGCATIVGQSSQTLQVSSTPSEASVHIADETGQAVFEGRTPTTVTLAKSNGHYWGGKDYTLTISKDGYHSQKIRIESHANGWYIAGNLVFGGLIGWFIVDPLNGGMYTLSPEQVNASLGPNGVAQYRFEKNTLSIMLVKDVPPELLSMMVPIPNAHARQ